LKCLHAFTEEELKRLNEALADDNSYSAVSFDYDSTNRTTDSSLAESAQGQLSTQLFCRHFYVS